eukprot:CAMPEP_0113307344 /NCGR_PEP_ID=MMETSP0010_2-20120614/6228_1 /TAXON_ID=216773 ORGANISM="Corethron hystrix, Strain 308" /NCGR_SAMPLE_ID=MMETSP0010_2 /ASSEMBLY_ACC=CAM_ASM_000155 /LENGTH=610 /DNA_ID=CAMNT_0000162183 /DNA_START=312 /DNA_END=2141 /DNA_ORIENTATION=- /assembly_acc=CAM_ASM_000155
MTEDQDAQISSAFKGFSKDPVLIGLVKLDYTTIFSQYCTEERFEFPIKNKLNEEDGFRGTLSLRFRIATKSDIEFVNTLNNKEKPKYKRKKESKHLLFLEGANARSIPDSKMNSKLATLTTEQDNICSCEGTFLKAIASLVRTKTLVDLNTGQTKIKVKPNPDPNRIDTTTFMTGYEIKNETRQPSHCWYEAGSGNENIGKVYVEVLSCHDLPNMDIGGQFGNLTDAFVTAVCENGVMQTSVIDDDLSPHWMPWTKRAFFFNIDHIASILYLAAFNYNGTPLFMHDPIGRVAVNLSNFKPGTVYTLKYNLYNSANVTERIKKGAITIRLRIEFDDLNAALTTTLHSQPKRYINVKNDKSFKVVRYTCFGEYDSDAGFDATIMLSYLNEIIEYKNMVSYKVGDAIKSLIFWRGQVEVSFMMLPLHSLFFFCACAIVVEQPYMFPSLLLLSIPWILLAMNMIKLQHPSPWKRCSNFWTYPQTIKDNISIDAYEGWEVNQAHEEREKRWLEEKSKDKEKIIKKMERLEELGNEAISTEVASNVIPLHIFSKLHALQSYTEEKLKQIRVVKLILSWEDGNLSFLVTAISLMIALVSLLLPWSVILTWTGRSIVW